MLLFCTTLLGVLIKEGATTCPDQVAFISSPCFCFSIMILTQYSYCLFAFVLSAALAEQRLSSNQFNLFPGPAEPDIKNSLDGSQDSALLFDGNDGVTNVLPPLGNPLRDIFPYGFPEFPDPEGILRWLFKPKRPDCDNGKFLFCCQLGPPRPLLDPNTPFESPERMAERQTRMRECVPCK